MQLVKKKSKKLISEKIIINQTLFILTTQEVLVNRKDLRAPTLVEPTQIYKGSGTP